VEAPAQGKPDRPDAAATRITPSLRRSRPEALRLVAVTAAFALSAAAGILGAAERGRAASRVSGLPRRAADLPVVRSHPAPLRIPGPWRVGLQAGHWRAEELPEEQRRLRDSTGARFGRYREADLNLEVARRAAELLRSSGAQVDLLPARIPAGYAADVFVSIHADGAARPAARGWKAATPWRASAAARELREALVAAFPRFTGLPEDRFGTTFYMRGYYAFSPHRYRHAIDPRTPAVILEMGFITVREDREKLFDDPQAAALGIAAGILRFLSAHDPYDRSRMAVTLYPLMRLAAQAPLLSHREQGALLLEELPEGTLVRPLHREEGWFEVMAWGSYRRFGWLAEASLEPLRAEERL
jgi:N-acetylmuramoyl-L-alanine amidase